MADLEKITINYAKFSDDKISEIANGDMSGFEPGVREIVYQEVQKRNLPENLLKVADAHQEEITDEEFGELLNIIEMCSCPSCGISNSKLKANLRRTVLSFIVFTTWSSYGYIACEACLSKERKKKLFLTALFGWWGFPMGLLRTPYSIVMYFIDSRKQEEWTKSIIGNFIIENLGLLRVNKKDSEEITSMIEVFNSRF